MQCFYYADYQNIKGYNCITNCATRSIAMRKFKIPKVSPTTNKCIRFPNDVIDEVENAIVNKDCTFSAFVIEAVKVALDNLKEDETE